MFWVSHGLLPEEETGDAKIWEKIVAVPGVSRSSPSRFQMPFRKKPGCMSPIIQGDGRYLTSRWKQELVGVPITPFERVIHELLKPTRITLSAVLDDGRVVAQKSGIGDIDHLLY